MNAVVDINKIFSNLFIKLSYFFELRTLLYVFIIAIVLSLIVISNRCVRSVSFIVFLIIYSF